MEYFGKYRKGESRKEEVMIFCVKLDSFVFNFRVIVVFEGREGKEIFNDIFLIDCIMRRCLVIVGFLFYVFF